MPAAMIRKPETKPLTLSRWLPTRYTARANGSGFPCEGSGGTWPRSRRRSSGRLSSGIWSITTATRWPDGPGAAAQHGHKSPRADIVIWESAEKKANNDTPVLVVECKAEGVDINVKDYYQGESYARAVGCESFIAHNTRFNAVFKLVPGLSGDFVQINEIARASD